jgi:exosome complex component RRP41
VQTALYPRAQIDIYVTVLQADGGVLAACVNAASCALAAAGVPLADLVCAVAAGAHGPQPLLDLTALEEADVPHVTVGALPRARALALVDMETRLHVDRFEQLCALAADAGAVLHAEMRRKIRERTAALAGAMGGRVGAGAAAGGEYGQDERMEEM